MNRFDSQESFFVSREIRGGIPCWRRRLQRLGQMAGSASLVLLLCGSSLFQSVLAATTAEAASEEAGDTWAILIGVERYHLALPLNYTINDVHQLARTLEERGSVQRNRIIKVVDDAELVSRRPLRETLLGELPKWLNRVRAEDRLIIYFSGHGFQDEQDQLYLAPIDCDPDKPAETGIKVQWLRDQLAACPAKFKLLVLDACHAGTEKGEEETASISAFDLGSPFKDLNNVVTLASAMADEKSLVWQAKQQSLFSYWLNQGLKGHADENGDATVDIDELNKFVHRNVSRSARVHFGREQTPVRIVRSGVPGVPAIIQLHPLGLQQVLSDISEQLSSSILERKLSKVGVLEFTTDSQAGEVLGANFGLLGRYCSSQVERRLMTESAGQFQVVDSQRMLKALKSQEFSVESLGSDSALKELSTRVGGMPAIALGTLRSRLGRVVTLQCRLMQTDDDTLAGFAAGTAWLNESEWGMLGISVEMRDVESSEADPAPSVDAQANAVEPADQVIRDADRRANQPHPLADPSFPYRVMIRAGGAERKAVFRGNDMLVPLSKGEEYEIWIENKTDDLVCMRLLVDGLNTLVEKDDMTKGIQTEVVAKRVNLDEARFWVLDPKRSQLFAVRGFVTKTGDQGKYRAFKVVDANESVAARQKFTDNLGIITAAFYRPGSASRGIGTGFGEERSEVLQTRKVGIGDLFTVMHIRYVEPEVLRELTE